MKRIILSLSFIIALVTAADPTAINSDLIYVRLAAEQATPVLKSAKSNLEIATILRDQIHRSPLSDDGFPIVTSPEFGNWRRVYTDAVIERKKGNKCGGKAIIYMIALKSFGIPSRIVSLYADKTADKVVKSHAVVDVLVDGKWIAEDPTFNLSFKNNAGENISWTDVIMNARNNEPIKMDSDGMIVLPNVGPMIDLHKHAKYANLGPWVGGDRINLNPDWDGKITYTQAKAYDTWGSLNSQLFKSLAR